MISTQQFLVFVAAALVMAITPGPNMIYLISRSICQGRTAGLMSLIGVVFGLTTHMLFAAAGLTAIFMAIPLGYELLKFGGAMYLLWMAWQAVRPGARSPFDAKDLPPVPVRRLFMMGYLTSVLNPKIAIFYLSILPQFIQPEMGHVLAQSLTLGITQIFIGTAVNSTMVLSAVAVSGWFSKNQFWLDVQRYVMGGVLSALALKLFMQQRNAA